MPLGYPLKKQRVGRNLFPPHSATSFAEVKTDWSIPDNVFSSAASKSTKKLSTDLLSVSFVLGKWFNKVTILNLQEVTVIAN